jgi:hypothetical protein
MKNQLLIASLLCGLAALPASAQMAPTPNGQNQQPGTSTPGTPPTFPTDRQETGKDQQNRQNTDADQYPSQKPDDQSQPPSTDRDYNRDRVNGSIGSNAGQKDQEQQEPANDRDHRSDYQSQLESALQKQPTLSGVHVTFTDTTVELTGAVPTGKDKHQARMMAQDYANGRKVVDHITVTGKEH